jgi:hypothetical protein
MRQGVGAHDIGQDIGADRISHQGGHVEIRDNKAGQTNSLFLGLIPATVAGALILV